ncbi:ABC transporter permease [Sphingomonas sp. AR_OL41]|uniref:ABC transporter permease n=1 Tax=Sphingomonas sp. AR_OL41 TaxID=3042729 RepID=UPI00247FDDD0|nr:ABC transporter permease [Sphingomonas sp. AR_OL41]MDH7971448.1 ABC transporter permease [Sphingomonas sp. AR_OL41]
MSRFTTLVRQTLTIARRDFVATVFTPTFLIFLFAPVVMGSFGAIGGLGASAATSGSGDKTRIVALVAGNDAQVMMVNDTQLRRVFRDAGEAPPLLRTDAPSADPAVQAHALIEDRGIDVAAVLYGPLDHPQVVYTPNKTRSAAYLAQLAEQTLRTARSGGATALSNATLTEIKRNAPRMRSAKESGFFAVFAIFFLTLLLAGQVVSGVAEERGNKVIEILAAAVPLESVFFGKLLGTFGVAVLFLTFWGTLITQITTLMPAGMAAGFAALTPAMGMPLFTLLFLAYFTMAYMLLGAVFLGVGAQASSVREIQLLSLPITLVQVSMFGLGAVAISKPNSWMATFAEVFPLSSPYYMAGRAAQSAVLWPHFAALAWQALWVAIFVAVGVRAFRRGVLQSGSGKFRWKALFGRS